MYFELSKESSATERKVRKEPFLPGSTFFALKEERTVGITYLTRSTEERRAETRIPAIFRATFSGDEMSDDDDASTF